MPTTKSAKKRLRQSLERRARNRSVKSSLKTHIKRVATAIASGDQAKVATEYRLTCKKLDQAAAAGVIHRNTAARHKSRLIARTRAPQAASTAK